MPSGAWGRKTAGPVAVEETNNGPTRDQLTLGQKKAKYRKSVKRHLTRLIRLLSAAVNHRHGIRKDAMQTKHRAGDAKEALAGVSHEPSESMKAIEKHTVPALPDST